MLIHYVSQLVDNSRANFGTESFDRGKCPECTLLIGPSVPRAILSLIGLDCRHRHIKFKVPAIGGQTPGYATFPLKHLSNLHL